MYSSENITYILTMLEAVKKDLKYLEGLSDE